MFMYLLASRLNDPHPPLPQGWVWERLTALRAALTVRLPRSSLPLTYSFVETHSLSNGMPKRALVQAHRTGHEIELCGTLSTTSQSVYGVFAED